MRCAKFKDRILNESGRLSARWVLVPGSEPGFRTRTATRVCTDQRRRRPLPAPRCMTGNMAAGKPLRRVKPRTFSETSAGNASRCLQNITKVFKKYACVNSPRDWSFIPAEMYFIIVWGFFFTVEGFFTWTRYKLMKSNRQFTLRSPILASELQISAELC